MKTRDEITREAIEAVASGEIAIPSPYYGDKCTPTDIQVQVSEPEPYFKFTNPDETREAISAAGGRVDSFVDYIGSDKIHDPILHFGFPQSPESVYAPCLNSFELDHNVSISVLRELGNMRKISGTCKTHGIPRSFSFSNYSPITARQMRAYRPVRKEEGVFMNIVRSPIAWAPEYDLNSDRLVGVVAENMLEPWTSSRIAYLIGDDASELEMQAVSQRVSKRALLEEAVLAEALAKLWIVDTQSGSCDEVFSEKLKDDEITPEYIQVVASGIRRLGIRNTIKLYASKSWSMPAFLDGTFRPEDIDAGENEDSEEDEDEY